MVELAEMIAQLRHELEVATASAQNSELRLELGPIELELAVVLGREGGGGAKIRFWVVELNGDASVSASTTQRIKLTLQPRLAGSTQTPWVSGDVDGRER